MSDSIFILWDERAANGDTDEANALCVARSEKEARRDTRKLGLNGIWYEYRKVPCPVSPDAPSGFRAEAEKPRYDLPPFNKEA